MDWQPCQRLASFSPGVRRPTRDPGPLSCPRAQDGSRHTKLFPGRGNGESRQGRRSTMAIVSRAEADL